MTLGYALSLPDSGENMFYKLNTDPCTKYSNIYDINKINPRFKVSKKQFNITETYDGFRIVSNKFKLFCENEGYSNLEFVDLSTPGFHWFKIHNIIQYDTDARKTRFINYSESCDGYEEIIGANPVYLKNKSVIEDGFYRTDVCFGSFHGKSPLYLVGELTKQKLIKAGFKEIYFEKVSDKY